MRQPGGNPAGTPVHNVAVVSDPAGRIEHMFESGRQGTRSVAHGPSPLATSAVQGWLERLAGLDHDVSDAERIDQLRALEELKAAAAAAQARVAADLDASVRADRAARGLPASEHGRGIASQVALARRESPSRGSRHLGLAKALVDEMPHTLAALTAGLISEWRATLLVRETACLSREDRGRVDAELLADPGRIDGMGDRSLVSAAGSWPTGSIRRRRCVGWHEPRANAA